MAASAVAVMGHKYHNLTMYDDLAVFVQPSVLAGSERLILFISCNQTIACCGAPGTLSRTFMRAGNSAVSVMRSTHEAYPPAGGPLLFTCFSF